MSIIATVSFRMAESGDELNLREMLYWAIYTADGTPPADRGIVDLPELSVYYTGWGRAGDIGCIAEKEGTVIAAAWVRLLPDTAPGYGFISADIPELSIAVKKDYRNAGIGSLLLKKLFDELKGPGVEKLSLSVDKANRSVTLYLRSGFSVVREDGDSYIMLRDAGQR